MKLLKRPVKINRGKRISNLEALLSLVAGSTGIILAPIRQQTHLTESSVTVESSLYYRVLHPAGDQFYHEITDQSTFCWQSNPQDDAIARAQTTLAATRANLLRERLLALPVKVLNVPSDVEKYFAPGSRVSHIFPT